MKPTGEHNKFLHAPLGVVETHAVEGGTAFHPFEGESPENIFNLLDNKSDHLTLSPDFNLNVVVSSRKLNSPFKQHEEDLWV